ncbi:hypothetical protein FRC00_009030, partial [Tulasnella sp. 408]
MDPRLDESTQNALIGSFNRMQLRGRFPHRPGWGTAGTPVTMRTNHFAITYPAAKLYDYTVKMEPRAKIRRIRKRVWQLLEEAPEFLPFKNHVVHDSGARIISSRYLPLPPNGLNVSIRHYDEDEDGPNENSVIYTLNITFNTQLDTNDLNGYLSGDLQFREFDPLPIISALNIILAHYPSRNGINVGRNRFFFPDPTTSKSLGSGLEALKGYYSSHLGLQNSDSALDEFGISVGREMAVVPGRILPPPAIMYGRGQVRVDDRASWNLREVQFIDPKPLRNWAVLVIRDGGRSDFLGPHDPNLINILNGFTTVCNRSGMTVLSDPAVATVTLPPKGQGSDPFRKQAIEAIRGALRSIRPKPTIVLVMLSNGDKYIYTGLKSLCDLILDVHTVCCHSQKIRKEKGQLQFFANIALKINMKLGGVNHTLDHDSLRWLLEEPTIMFGSDVTHPSPGSLKGTPSIAAVVASIDDKFAHYPASLRLQESRKEMITDLSLMVQERLDQYRVTSRKLPRRIIFFRDGVSEGQFYTVIQEELPKIKDACARMVAGGGYRPKITMCIAGKRHHTRFYPTNEAGSDMNGNPRAGTVVDRGVTAIYDFDFFLQAHGGLQGTTRPTHYYVVHDENNFTADALQRLTNATSYMFGRATRAVSLIPPAYYADLACERGRCYIHELLTAGEIGSDGAAPPTDQQVFEDAERLWGQGIGPNLKKT